MGLSRIFARDLMFDLLALISRAEQIPEFFRNILVMLQQQVHQGEMM
jgi:hypothetical protein